MNQIAMTHEPRHEGAILPHVNTQHYALLMAFYRGEKLTVLRAIQGYGVYALSQRCGELKRLGWPIQSRTLHANGKSFSEYWIDFQ